MKERYKCIAAVYLLLFRGDELLLLRRYNTGYRNGEYSLPAGHLDGGETARQAMVREAQEEIGITLNIDRLELVHVIHRNPLTDTGDNVEYIDFFFKTENFTGEPAIMESNKCDELRWVDPKELPENVIPYVRQAIKKVTVDIVYSESGW